MTVYTRVRDLREDRDLTQKDIALHLNMQLTVYQRYERGERELPLWAAIISCGMVPFLFFAVGMYSVNMKPSIKTTSI